MSKPTIEEFERDLERLRTTLLDAGQARSHIEYGDAMMRARATEGRLISMFKSALESAP